MGKIAVIGERESVLSFKAVGLDVFPCKTGDQASKLIHRLAKEEYAILYITEDLVLAAEGAIDEYKDTMLPSIIPIPSKEGPSGNGLLNVKKAVERAVGADILFGGDNE